MTDALGVHILRGEVLLAMLQRVEAGETADDVYIEMYSNAEHHKLDLGLWEEDDGGDV